MLPRGEERRSVDGENGRRRKRAVVRNDDASARVDELFAQGFEHSPIGMALTSLDGKFERVNSAFARLLGYGAPDELVGVSFASLTHPDDAAQSVGAIGVLLERDTTYQAEKRYIRRDGAVVHVLLAVAVVRDACGQPVKFFTQVEDITERKAAESERARLATIVECSQDAIIGEDRDGIITVWNTAAERLYGYSASEAIGQSVGMLVPEARNRKDQEILGSVLAGERVEHYQTERLCNDGSAVSVSLSVSPIHDDAGHVTGAASIARDVTSMIEAQEQIALQAELLDDVDAAVTLTDEEGVIRYWSRGAEELYGYLAVEAVGRNVADLLMLEADRSEFMRLRADAQAGSTSDAEIEVRDKRGRFFPVYVRNRPMPPVPPSADSRGVISISVDVTARRESELAIRRHAAGQEELADLGRLALAGASLEHLFATAVGAAWRVLSSDCAWLVKLVPDGSDPILTAEIGWPELNRGTPITGEARSLSGTCGRSGGSVIVQDWEQQERFPYSSQRSASGVRSSVGVSVGIPGSPVGVLEVQYAQPHAVRSDCLPFLTALAHVLGDAIQSRETQELVRRQRESLAVLTESLRKLVGDRERLIEQIPGVVLVCDLYADGSGTFVFVSSASEPILGVPASELLGDTTRFLRHLHDEDRDAMRTNARQSAASQRDPSPSEFRFTRPDGTQIWLRGVSAFIRAEDECQRIQSVLFDITAGKQAELERERLELDLHLAQKLEAVGQLAAGVAHEINTPVQFIGDSILFLKRAADELRALTSVYHELLHSDDPIDREERRRRAVLAEEDCDLEYLTERVPPAFERALEGIDRVSTIVRAMRQFAHPSNERAPTDVNEGIRTTLIISKNEYKYVADIELDLGEIPPVMANAGDLNQVFLNLIVNAAHAIEPRVGESGERGKITVRTQRDEAGVLVSVTDTGCGIGADIADRVFDPFFTTKLVGRGTGQGLTIAHTIIVERHHGAINFEPAPGGGTTFRVHLPFDAPAAATLDFNLS